MNKGLYIIFCGIFLISVLTITSCSDDEMVTEKRNIPEAKTDRIVIEYVRPENPEYLHFYTLLKDELHTLESLQIFLSPFKLPWTLDIVLEECDGEADAFYDDDAITICYEYLQELWDYMPEETTPAGVEPIDTFAGPFVDTVLHEFAHALFDYLDIPVLGREEDAADQVSAYLYLKLGPEESRRLIIGTVYAYMLEVQDTDAPTLEEFADEHSATEVRRFNLLCMAYGANPEVFADVVVLGELPEFRVEICEEEFELIALAYETLISPHVDQDMAKKVFDQSWLSQVIPQNLGTESQD